MDSAFLRLILVSGVLAGGLLLPAEGWGSPRYFEDMRLEEVHSLLRSRMRDQSEPTTRHLAAEIIRLSRAYDFRVAFVLSVIQTESSFRTQAVSSAGAIGLMQLQPATAKYLAKRMHYTRYRTASDLTNPEVNIALGIYYLAYLRRRHSSVDRFLSAYNMGPTRTNRLSNQQIAQVRQVRAYIERIQSGARQLKQEAIKTVLFGRPSEWDRARGCLADNELR